MGQKLRTITVKQWVEAPPNDVWAVLTEPRSWRYWAGLGDVTIEAGSQGSFAFSPIAFDDIDGTFQGSTANLVLDFRGQTVAGDSVSTTVGRQLFVEQCN